MRDRKVNIVGPQFSDEHGAAPLLRHSIVRDIEHVRIDCINIDLQLLTFGVELLDFGIRGRNEGEDGGFGEIGKLLCKFLHNMPRWGILCYNTRS